MCMVQTVFSRKRKGLRSFLRSDLSWLLSALRFSFCAFSLAFSLSNLDILRLSLPLFFLSFFIAVYLFFSQSYTTNRTTENLFKNTQHFGIQVFGLNNDTNMASCTPYVSLSWRASPLVIIANATHRQSVDWARFCKFQEWIPISLASEFL